LAAAGAWLARRETHLRLLALSFACTWLGYFMVWFDQGYGWGARYLHPALAALPVLGAAAILRLASEPLRRYAAAAALLSLAIAQRPARKLNAASSTVTSGAAMTTGRCARSTKTNISAIDSGRLSAIVPA